MTLGEHLKSARTLADLTQREVEKRTGINYKTLSNWENNVSNPSPDDLITLADVYHVTIDKLVGHISLLNDPLMLGHHDDQAYREAVEIAHKIASDPEIRKLVSDIVSAFEKRA